MNLDYWIEHANKKAVFGHKDELYRTNQKCIVELGFLGVHSDEDHQS
jgi:hypothetical protein